MTLQEFLEQLGSLKLIGNGYSFSLKEYACVIHSDSNLVQIVFTTAKEPLQLYATLSKSETNVSLLTYLQEYCK